MLNNQTRYGDLNVSTQSDTITLLPGYKYIIRSAFSSITTNDDTNKDQETQLPLTNIAIILLIIAAVIYSVFKASRKRR